MQRRLDDALWSGATTRRTCRGRASAWTPVIGANSDPSHRMGMGDDPIAALHARGGAIHRIHAKDVRRGRGPADVAGPSDTCRVDEIAE